ncbi:hypothetical protein SLS58_009494 [Diplodia intermedia]|uniref:Uncharacterized protein n=1 Tax=Diplodia intermedia TaxID=856260 RepID=A0ABR3TBW4_9PEZI
MVDSKETEFKPDHSAGDEMPALTPELPDDTTESTPEECTSVRVATRSRRQHLPILELPGEIRNMIYSYVVDKSWHSTTWSVGGPLPSYVRVNRQMRAEMLPIYYGRLNVTMDLDRQERWEDARRWLLAVGDSVRFLGNVTIIVADSAHSWGVMTFTIATSLGDIDYGFRSEFRSPYTATGEADILDHYSYWLYEDIRTLKDVGALNARNLIALLSAFYSTFRAVSRQARATAGLPPLNN